MSVNVVAIVASMLSWPISLCWLYATLRAPSAIPGSHVKYVLNTVAVGTSIVLSSLDAVQAVCQLYKAEYFYAGVYTLLVVFYLYYAKKFYDEDNWFKNQFTKLKNGIKNLGQRIVQSLTPAPLGSLA